MEGAHHLRLLAGYGTVSLIVLVWTAWRRTAPTTRRVDIVRPGWELGLIGLSVVALIGLGQLYQAGVRLPATGPLGPLLESLNQALIFAPLWLLLLRPGHGLASAWVPDGRRRAVLSGASGLGLACVAVVAFLIAAGALQQVGEVLAALVTWQHVDEAVQVALEDLAIAMLLVRLGALTGKGWAIGITASLFAAGHVPALLSDGAEASDVLWLLPDVGLGLLVLIAITRARNILWFWPVHVAMDLMQFDSVFGRAA